MGIQGRKRAGCQPTDKQYAVYMTIYIRMRTCVCTVACTYPQPAYESRASPAVAIVLAAGDERGSLLTQGDNADSLSNSQGNVGETLLKSKVRRIRRVLD